MENLKVIKFNNNKEATDYILKNNLDGYTLFKTKSGKVVLIQEEERFEGLNRKENE